MATENPERSEVREPAEIERDIAQTREAIDSTVDELGQRLAPSQLMDDAKSYVKETAMRGANSLWSTLSDNAIPLLMIGGGMVWMASSRRASAWSNGDYPTRFASGYQGGAAYQGGDDWEPASSNSSGMAHRTAEKARMMGERVRERSADVAGRAQEQLHRAQHGIESMRQEQPLLMGVAAFALGGLVGGLLPATHREDQLVGEMRDDVVGAAVQAGREQVEHVREAAQDLVESAGGKSDEGQQGAQQAGEPSGSQPDLGEQQIGREGGGRTGGRARSSRPSPSPRI